MIGTKNTKKILEILKKEKVLSALQLAQKIPELNTTTIYRNLTKLEQAGEVQKIHVSENEAKYELAQKDHHHALCSDCKKVFHIQADDQKILKTLGIEKNFEVKSIEVIVKGRCRE